MAHLHSLSPRRRLLSKEKGASQPLFLMTRFQRHRRADCSTGVEEPALQTLSSYSDKGSYRYNKAKEKRSFRSSSLYDPPIPFFPLERGSTMGTVPSPDHAMRGQPSRNCRTVQRCPPSRLQRRKQLSSRTESLKNHITPGPWQPPVKL